MEPIKLIVPTEEYLDQVWAYRQECIDAGSSMDGCGPLRPSESKEQWLAHVRAYMGPATVPCYPGIGRQSGGHDPDPALFQ